MTLQLAFAAVLALCPGGYGISSQDTAPEDPRAKAAEAKIRRIRHLLDIELETRAFPKDMRLADFLTAVAKLLPKGKNLTLRIDQEAFGKNYATLAEGPVRFLSFPPKHMRLGTMLHLVGAKAGFPVDFLIEPNGIVFTTPDRALFSLTYDVRDILDKWDTVRAGLKRTGGNREEAAKLLGAKIESGEKDKETQKP